MAKGKTRPYANHIKYLLFLFKPRVNSRTLHHTFITYPQKHYPKFALPSLEGVEWILMPSYPQNSICTPISKTLAGGIFK
jgi:hypothetical protein